MKLMQRLWPLNSFLCLLDLKTGVTIALLFALLNKVAGVYGLIAVLTGAGGSFAQLSLYVYSTTALVALAWGLRAIREEDAKQTLYFAHAFFADHVFSTSWTVFFAVLWWIYTPHDGRQQANSPAQQEMIAVSMDANQNLTEEARIQAAVSIWNHEKRTAAAVITLSWLAKIYFAMLLYSYALHLRRGSYRLLPMSRSPSDPTPGFEQPDDTEDPFELPLHSPYSAAEFISAPRKTKKPKLPSHLVPAQASDDMRNGEVVFDSSNEAVN